MCRFDLSKGVFKGAVQPPPEIFRFFLKSERKEVERKRLKGMWGGGVIKGLEAYL